MTMHGITRTPLSFNGVEVRDRNEMLSLTDMWKAEGSPSGRAPNDWRTLTSSIEFSDHVAEILNAGKSGNDLFKVSRGGRTPGTWAHWQIALAYAKYLSPEFHMQCNVVIRERMEESRRVGGLTPELVEMIERTNGIAKTLSHKVTELEKAIPLIVSQILPTAVAGYVAEHNLSIADGLTAGEVCDLAKVSTSFPRGLSGRVSARLTKFCLRNGERPRVSRLGRVRAQLFPTHLVRDWLEVEGRALIRRWLGEAKGQAVLPFSGNRGGAK